MSAPLPPPTLGAGASQNAQNGQNGRHGPNGADPLHRNDRGPRPEPPTPPASPPTARVPRSPGEQRPPLPAGRRWLVAGAATAGVAVVAHQTERIFAGDYEVWAVVGMAVVAGALTALVARLHAVVTLLVAIAATVGGAAVGVAVHDGVLPDDLTDVVTSGINAIVAAVWPSPAVPASAGAIGAAVALAASVAVALAVRRIAAASLLPSLALVGLVALLSAPAGAPPMWSVSAYAAAALMTFRWQHAGGRGRVGRLWTAVVVALAVLLPLALGGLASADRYDPRTEVDAPAAAQDALSPLARVDEWRGLTPQEIMFRSDVATPGRWRLVGLTRYDGFAWLPADDYRRAGTEVGRPELEGSETASAAVTIGALDSLWLPTVGTPLRVSTEVRVDGGRSGLLPLVEPVEGSEYRFDYEVIGAFPAQLSAAPASSDAATPGAADALPASIRELATTITAGAITDFQRAQAIATYLRDQYALDPETPTGHSLAILELFLERSRRGRDEQFVAAYGVLAAAVGLPVRIAVGFETEPTSDGGTHALSSAAVAWPEVAFDGFGWVPFDPVPEEQVEAPPASGDGAVAPVDDATTPPPATTVPASPDTTVPEDDTVVDDSVEVADEVSPAVVRAVAGASLLVLLVAAYVITVLVLKRRRRRRRRAEAANVRRARGAFSTGVDVLVDAGVRTRGSATDRELVTAGSRTVGDAAVLLAPAADQATAAVYDPDSARSVNADEAWSAVERFEEQMAAQLGPLRWWRTKLSVRSLRRGLRD